MGTSAIPVDILVVSMDIVADPMDTPTDPRDNSPDPVDTLPQTAPRAHGYPPLSSPTAASGDSAKESRARAISSSPEKCWAMWSRHTEQMLWMALAAADARRRSHSPFIR